MAARRSGDRSHTLASPPIESVELFTFNNNGRRLEQNANFGTTTVSWHPKLTLYRLLVLVATVGLGAAKAITSYLSLNNASITLEWVLGVVVFLFFHVLGSYESHGRPLRWLFHVDYSEHIWNLLAIFDIERPSYRSDELDDIHLLARRRHPPITGYHILVTTLVVFFGMLKSAFWYGNRQNEVTTVECVFGIGIVTCLYWLGLYESSSTKIYPWLFHVDYSDKFFYGLVAFSVIGKATFYILGLALSSGITLVFYYLTTLVMNLEWALSMFPPFPIVGYTTSLMFASLMLSIFLGSAGWWCFLVFTLSRMVLGSPFGRYLLRMSGRRYLNSFVRSVYEDYWLPSPTSRQRRNRSFYLKRVLIRQLIRLPVRFLFLYIIFLLLLILVWLSLMIAAHGATFVEPLVPITFTFPFLSFIFLSLLVWGSTIFVDGIKMGFRTFLSEILHDYSEGSSSVSASIPISSNHNA